MVTFLATLATGLQGAGAAAVRLLEQVVKNVRRMVTFTTLAAAGLFSVK